MMSSIRDQSIHIGGNVSGSNVVSGNSTNSFNKSSQSGEFESLLRSLEQEVSSVKLHLSDDKAELLADDLDRFIAEVNKEKPSQKWYGISAQGIISAANTVGEVGKPILKLVPLITKALGMSF
ncbi:MAG: hypothetical protein AAFZ17_00645 [Cyanobacteria bacterium J06650_10]